MYKKSPIFDFIYPIIYHVFFIAIIYFIVVYFDANLTIPFVGTAFLVVSYICYIISCVFKYICMIIETKGEYGYEESMWNTWKRFNVARMIALVLVVISAFLSYNRI